MPWRARPSRCPTAAGDAACGAETVDRLVGAPRAHPYADTSPAELPPPPIPEVVINGQEEPLAPPAMGAAYVARMQSRGGHLRQAVVAGTGHVELIAPGTAAWEQTTAIVLQQLAR